MSKRRRRRLKRAGVLMAPVILLAGVILALQGWSGQPGEVIEDEHNGQAVRPQQDDNGANSANSEKTADVPDKDRFVTIRLAAVGDIMFHQAQLDSAWNEAASGYDFKPVFEAVKPIIETADAAIANLETTMAGAEQYRYAGYPRFNTPDEAAEAIRYAGFDIVTTANNHSLDTGKAGLVRTLETLQKHGLDSVGTYADRPDSRVLMKDVQGIRLAFLSYTESLNGLESLLTAEELDYMVNMADEGKILEDIDYAQRQGADFIVAGMHWGNEYEREPSARQQELARKMADAGVDLILGSHPHVIQKSEWLPVANGKQSFVIYSMGNFLSNQREETIDNAYTEDGVIVLFELRKDTDTGNTAILGIDYVPTWVYRDQVPGMSTFTYQILPAADYKDDESFPAHFRERMARSYRDTMAQMEEGKYEL